MLDFLVFVALVFVLVAGFHTKGPASMVGRWGFAFAMVLAVVVMVVVFARFQGSL